MLAVKVIRAKGVMIFSSTCHNELEEMSRDGSRSCKKWCVETELFQPRGLGVIGPLRDESICSERELRISILWSSH
jgi:hypothetical protein